MKGRRFLPKEILPPRARLRYCFEVWRCLWFNRMPHCNTRPNPSPTPTMQKRSMSPWRRFAVFAGALLTIAIRVPISHAAAATPEPTRTNSADRAVTDEYVELSPLVVNESKANGYQAASTLAGTRLDTPLKDLGA